MSRKKLREYHLEVTQALTAMGNPVYGKAVQEDRGSQLEHLGITFPRLRLAGSCERWVTEVG